VYLYKCAAMKRIRLLTLLSLIFMATSCNSQNREQPRNDRQPAVAGQFYAGDAATLNKDLKALFDKAIPKKISDVIAVIAPHAGYVFSGEVAASAFNQIDENKQYTDIFVIGSSHSSYFSGASVYCDGDFITPLGTVEVDTALAKKLVKENAVIKNYKDVHIFEHSLEVQLPFLQYKMKKPFRIVPVVIGTSDAADCKRIAKALEPYFNSDNLFVISTDFSHYPNNENAKKVDFLTAQAIESNSPAQLLETLKYNEKLCVPNLATSLCGWSSVLTLLYITENLNDITISTLQYKNSGDTPVYGDSLRVVGYTAMAVNGKITSKMNEEFSLSSEDKKDLMGIARSTLTEYIKNGKIPAVDTSGFSSTIKQNCGAFVTLHKQGRLRGCIGRFEADKPLYLVVQDMTIAAATEDYRFSRVVTDELNTIDMEISVLSPLKLIKSIDEIGLGKHGIYIKKGSRGGTFLPQVATETGWSKEEFLGHCAEDKAGLGWYGWKDADIYIYSAIVFGEKDVK
ncbi:MAG TPA: AmmeMemoRadiSam system protein B, partial [Bacteroidales bacterium]|nr:AmmeMemoRadiSam system protein B [Bacteroidales bacterium]